MRLYLFISDAQKTHGITSSVLYCTGQSQGKRRKTHHPCEWSVSYIRRGAYGMRQYWKDYHHQDQNAIVCLTSVDFWCVLSRSVTSDSVTSWTVAHQALCPWDFPGKNTGVGCHFLLQRVFLTQRLNLHLLHFLRWQADSLPLHHLGISTLLNMVQLAWDLSRAMETMPHWHSREGQAILWKMLGSPEMSAVSITRQANHFSIHYNILK